MNSYPIKVFKVQSGLKFDPTKDFVIAKSSAEEALLRQDGYTDIATAMTIVTQGRTYAWFDKYRVWLLIAGAVCILYVIWMLISLEA